MTHHAPWAVLLGIVALLWTGLTSAAEPKGVMVTPSAVTKEAAVGRLPLSDAEQAWVASHPVVHVGLPSEFPPYYFAAEQGRYDGFAIALTSRLAERVGLRLKYTLYASQADTLDAVKRGEVDMLPFSSESPERPLFSAQMVYVTNRALTDLRLDEKFSNYRVVVERGTGGEDVMRQRFPLARLTVLDNADAAILAVASGDADVFVGFRQVAVYYMEKHLTANLAVRGSLGSPSTALGPAVRKDLPELASMLNRANIDLGPEEIAGMAAKWLPRSLLTATPRANAELSAPQRAWIKRYGSLRLGFDAAFSPIAFTNAAGGFDGLAADITRAVAAKVGMIVGLEQGGSFADVYERAQRGDLDVIVAAARNAERAADFDFVGPFLSFPTVVVAAVGRDSTAGLDDPSARTLALLKKHFLIPSLRSRYPRLKVQEYASQEDVLRAVRGGQADLGLGNLKVTNLLLERQHTGALQIVGTVPDGDSQLYFAVRRDLPELAGVLRTGLDAVTPPEMAAMENRWLRVEVATGVPWARVWAGGAMALALASLVIGCLWYSNWRLRQAQRSLQQARLLAEEQVQARSSFVAYLSHELRGTLGGLSGGLGLLQDSAMPAGRRDQLTQAMRASANGLLDLCERTLDFERALHGGLDLQLAPAVLVDVIDNALAPWRVQAELKGLGLRTQHDFRLSTRIQCDAVRLTQVLHNLVGNAVKFTPQGSVTVTTSVTALDDALVASAGSVTEPPAAERMRLTIIITDTGPGIPEAERQRLFKPFSQGTAGRRERRGAGLGLSISARIVQAAAGALELGSTSAQGSSFVVRMPVVIVANAPAPERAANTAHAV
jgi:two-component system, NarL family, sensor histidine kinase EvgS